jgi:hypothetical protein
MRSSPAFCTPGDVVNEFIVQPTSTLHHERDVGLPTSEHQPMPQHEFELYLRLLANLLDLQPSQREEIRDELRDHLEERLAELAKLGVGREQAIERALEEFGDAAGLAGSFTKLARERQRRRLMYRTTGTAVVVTLVLLTAAALWPVGNRENPVGPQHVGAQDEGFEGGAGAFGGLQGNEGGDVASDESATVADDAGGDEGTTNLRNRVEAALERPIDVHFQETPFSEVVANIGASIDVDILIDESALTEYGVPLDEPTSLVLNHSRPPARAVIELLLQRHGLEADLALVVRDGFAHVTSIDFNAQEVEVYNVRDLVTKSMPTPMSMEGAATYGGEAGGSAPVRFVQALGGFSTGGMSDMGGGGFASPLLEPPAVEGIEGLLHVVRTTVAPSTWDLQGGPGTIAAFDGMIVVSNSSEVHRRVRALLEKLRDVGETAAPKPAAGRGVRSPFGNFGAPGGASTFGPPGASTNEG